MSQTMDLEATIGDLDAEIEETSRAIDAAQDALHAAMCGEAPDEAAAEAEQIRCDELVRRRERLSIRRAEIESRIPAAARADAQAEAERLAPELDGLRKEIVAGLARVETAIAALSREGATVRAVAAAFGRKLTRIHDLRRQGADVAPQVCGEIARVNAPGENELIGRAIDRHHKLMNDLGDAAKYATVVGTVPAE